MWLNDAVETFKRHAEDEEGTTEIEHPQRRRADGTEPQSVRRVLGITGQEQMSTTCKQNFTDVTSPKCLLFHGLEVTVQCAMWFLDK